MIIYWIPVFTGMTRRRAVLFSLSGWQRGWGDYRVLAGWELYVGDVLTSFIISTCADMVV